MMQAWGSLHFRTLPVLWDGILHRNLQEAGDTRSQEKAAPRRGELPRDT
jgi:hypothetical protein